MALVLCTACSVPPAHPQPPEGAVPAHFVLRMRGEVVGAERRYRSADGLREVRERDTAWRVGGVDQVRHHHVELERTDAGWRRRLDDGPWTLVPPPLDGEVVVGGAAVDPFGAQGGPVRMDATGRRVDGHPELGSVETDAAGQLLVHRWGALELAPVAVAPSPWPLADVDRLTRVPVTSGVPRTRPDRALREVRWDVDGRSVAVSSPLPGELPRRGPVLPEPPGHDAVARLAATAAGAPVWPGVQRLVAATAAALSFAPVLEGGGPEAVLARGAGDCTEHVEVFVAAARRVGLDARPVAGGLLKGDALVPHAWAEVQVGERWVAVDPTLGLAPADAGRLPLDARPALAASQLTALQVVRLVDAR